MDSLEGQWKYDSMTYHYWYPIGSDSVETYKRELSQEGFLNIAEGSSNELTYGTGQANLPLHLFGIDLDDEIALQQAMVNGQVSLEKEGLSSEKPNFGNYAQCTMRYGEAWQLNKQCELTLISDNKLNLKIHPDETFEGGQGVDFTYVLIELTK